MTDIKENLKPQDVGLNVAVIHIMHTYDMSR